MSARDEIETVCRMQEGVIQKEREIIVGGSWHQWAAHVSLRDRIIKKLTWLALSAKSNGNLAAHSLSKDELLPKLLEIWRAAQENILLLEKEMVRKRQRMADFHRRVEATRAYKRSGL